MKRAEGLRSRWLATCLLLAGLAIGAIWLSSVRTLADPSEPAEAAPAHPEAAPANATWEKRWWIEKIARLLRNGEGLGPDDDIARLEKLTKEEIVREFMADERFGDTVLDFNMYFLGFKADSVKVDGNYQHSAFDFPNAISSAKALIGNGDYLKLFDLEGDYYFAPLATAPSEEDLTPEDSRLSAKQLRDKAETELSSKLKALLALRKGPKRVDFDEFCDQIAEFSDQRDELTKAFNRAFTDAEIFVLLRGSVPEFIFDGLDKVTDDECEKPKDKHDIKRLEDTVAELSTRLDRAFAEIARFEPTVYWPETLAEFKPLILSAFPRKGPWPAFGVEQGTALANSSTNYNRKRAAYVLKRFFCDDLNPVGFDDPKEHVSGAHGSQTSCYSCHYKLDPMAGFFRNHGALFGDASSTPDIVFDDLASMDRKKYLSAWSAPPGSGRAWDVGYIRSPRWTEQNEYGESLADLSRIIRKAPEAKRCLMKRLTEYVLGENQTVDGGYLDFLTQNFEKDAAVNSSIAMKNAVTRVLLTETYQTRNPDPRRCYDLAPGTNTSERPPCRVAYILQKNCVRCHNEDEALNTLDLTKWVQRPGEKRQTFPHFTMTGDKIPAAKTFEEMSSRLSSTDPKFRMPKNKLMSSQERQELYLWLQSELARRQPE